MVAVTEGVSGEGVDGLAIGRGVIIGLMVILGRATAGVGVTGVTFRTAVDDRKVLEGVTGGCRNETFFLIEVEGVGGASALHKEHQLTE